MGPEPRVLSQNKVKESEGDLVAEVKMPEAASIAVPAAAEAETERRKISRQYSRPEDVKV